MNRLTDRSKEIPLPCADNSVFWARVHEKLARYEDTGLEPEEMREMLHDSTGPLHKKLGEWIDAEQEGRLLVLPCGDDVTLEYNGLLYKGDHWNPPTLTAFAPDPSTRSGLRVHCFGIEDAEKALEGTKNDE